MPKYFDKSGNEVALDSLKIGAEASDMELLEYMNEFGFTSDEGKTTVPGETTPPTEPVKETAAGDSSLADTSLESPEIDLLPGLQYAAEKDLFSVDETEGRKRLEAYFKGVPGIVFEEVAPGRDFLEIKYYDQNKNKEFRSERLSFDTKDKDSIAKNMEILSSFISTNIPEAYSSLIPANLEKLKEKRSKNINSYITPEFTESNDAAANSPSLFEPVQETKVIGSGGAERSAGSQSIQVTTYPYEKELAEASQSIASQAEATGITLTPENLRLESEKLVRAQVKNEGILNEKRRIAQQLIEDNIPAQGEAWISDVIISKEVEGKAKENEQLQIASIEQNASISRASNNINKLINGEAMTLAEQETMVDDFAALGINIDRANQTQVELEDGRVMPEEYYKAAVQLGEMYEANYSDYQRIAEEGAKIDSDIENVSISLDASRRSYDLGDKALYNVGLGFGELGLATAQLAAEAGKSNNPVLKIVGPAIDVGIQNIQNRIDESRDQFARDVDFKNAFDDPSNFGKFALQEVANQIPILVSMIASGGSAAYVAGATSAGSKMIEMKGERMAGDADYSDLEIALKATGYGLAEGVFAQITTVPILNRAKQTWVRAGKSDVVDGGTKAFFREKSTSLIYEPLLEAGGEGATQGTQNLIDGKPFMEGIDHAGVSGFGFGLLFAGIPFMKGMYSSRYSDYTAKESIRSKQLELDKLAAEWKVSQSDADMQRLEVQMSKLRQELTEDIEQQENIIDNNLRAAHGQYIVQATEEQSKLQNEAKAIQDDASLSREQKKNRIEALRPRFDFLQRTKEQSLSEANMMKARPEFVALQISDKKRYDRLINESKARLMRESGIAEPTSKQIEAEAYEVYLRETIIENNNQAGKTKGADLKQFETREEAVAAIKNGSLKMSESLAAGIIENVNNGAEGFSLDDGAQVVIIENQIASQTQHTGAHEVGHYVFDKLTKNNEAKFAAIATQLLKSVKAQDNKLYKELVASVEIDEDTGTLKSYEVISRFLELVAAKKVNFREQSKARGLAGLFGVNLQKEFVGEYNFDFKGEQDIVNFVVGLGQKIAAGTLSTEDIIAASENIILEGETASSKATDQVKFSKTLLGDINALVPESVQTREQFFDRKVFNPIYNDGKLHPSIANYIRSRAVSKEEAQKIIESVGDRLVNFNPEAKRKSGDAKITLGEFIFSNVNFGKLDARKALFEEGQERARTESTDSETAKQVVAKEESTIPVKDKPTYKTLTKRRVLGEDAKSAAEAKVLSNVRVLKSRIDAKVGKNVTVTPLIAEIKKTLGKQLDIDFKKEMGGKKDGQLRKYLLRNKAAILENMTTTWLMTAMPNAVQKQVNGVWTSNWQGQKIDREAVSTDNAGRTSGAELVRRLPKAATRLSDADYLSNVLDASGAPIRGRKESLAKAMAEQYAIEIIRDGVADPDSKIGKAFLDNQTRKGVEVTETTAVEINRQAEQGNVKFSYTPEPGNETIIREELDLGIDAQNKTDEWLRANGISKGLPKFKTEKDVDEYVSDLKENLFPIMPKSFFFGKQGGSTFTSSNSNIGVKSSKDPLWKYFKEEIAKARDDKNTKFAPETGVNFNMRNFETLFKNEAAVLKAKANGDLAAYNKQVAAVHKAMWQAFNKAIRADKTGEVTRAIAKYLHFSTNHTTHPHRMGAQFIAWSKGFDSKGKDGGKITYEHAMPSITAYLYLLDAAKNGYNFDRAYNAVMANFKMIALDKLADKKLGGVYKTGMPKGWSVLTGNWAQRYFNPLVFSNDGGIDPESIIMIDGRTLGEVTGIKADGTFKTEAGVKFSKSVNQDALKEAKEKINAPNPAVDTKGLSGEFNNILERKTGVESFKTFSAVQAQKRGEKKGRFKFFIAPSVDDFRGLVNYAFAGKGKQGEADMKWLEDNLMTPYAKGIAAINGIRQQIKRDFKTAVKAFPKQYQLLNKEIGKTGFTYDQAVRVYLWGKAGIKVPGLSQKDTKILQDAIRENPELMDFADAMLVVARRDTWMEPSEHWSASTLLSDLNSMTEKIGRKKYLEEFIANADAIFTEENLNKIEALYGRAHRDAIVDALYSMKNGTNRNAGGNKQVNAWLNWINGSTGAIMFFNRRSALLQMLSTVNFINYSDNNPLKAAAAFANQKQYWTDWAMIFNSDKLKERRGGLKQDVSSNEIASIANANKNSPQAILARLLQLGFTPTQIADSMAIASGGATFYRNRVNTYLKKGMTQKEAEQQAFLDFSKISDETQQSSDPALVSQVQRSNLGRLVFAFQNTPMQMTRLMKKDALDIINGRGDWRVKVARITYYGAIQNFIFSSLQSALFAMLPGFDDDDEDLTAAELDKKNAKEEAKIARVLNSMLDTLLRGSGVYGAVFSTVKNTIREYNKQEEKGFMSDHAYTVLSLFNISPPISSKARKIHSAIQTKKFEKDEIAARGWGIVADGRLDLGPNWTILGKVLSAAVSVPLDRVVDELTSISEAFDARNKAWQRIALALGWKTWDVGAIEENAEAIKAAAKKKRKEAGTKKAKETRRKKAKKLEQKKEQERINDPR